MERIPAGRREGTEGLPWMMVPPILTQWFAVGIERIDDAVLSFAPFAHREQVNFDLGVVQEAVCDPRACGKSNGIARLQSMKMPVEPDVGSPSMT
jgi:hypothetical protein